MIKLASPVITLFQSIICIYLEIIVFPHLVKGKAFCHDKLWIIVHIIPDLEQFSRFKRNLSTGEKHRNVKFLFYFSRFDKYISVFRV